MNSIRIAVSHLRDRLKEKSTFAGIVGAIGGGAALAYPFNWIAILLGVFGVLIPTS